MIGSVFFVLAVALATQIGGQEFADPKNVYERNQPLIAGGSNAAAGQFPSVVTVELPTPMINAFCGGVILNKNHVLTSARCMLTPQNTLLYANQVNVRFGAVQLSVGTPRVGVSAIYVHDQYNPFTFENNIAMLRTSSNFVEPEEPVPNVAFAALYAEVPFDGQACQVAGWNSATATPVQQFIDALVLNRDKCNALDVHYGNIRESQLCAGDIYSGPGVCTSNLGTGLFCEGQLAGILSTGLGCGLANQPGVYTQIRFYLPWIQKQFLRQDIPLGGSTPIPAM